MFGNLKLIHWNLFGAWCLSFGAYPDTTQIEVKFIILKKEPPNLENSSGNAHDDENTQE